MIRLVVRVDDGVMAANVGGAVLTSIRTFDVDLPEVEAVLTNTGRGFDGTFCHAQIVGAEVLPAPPVQQEG